MLFDTSTLKYKYTLVFNYKILYIFIKKLRNLNINYMKYNDNII